MKHIDLDPDKMRANCGEEMTPRVVQYHGKRYCIRLEQPYWNVLEAEAKSRGCKLNQVVHEYYTHPDAEANKTAFLRLRTVEWLAETLAHQQVEKEMNPSEIKSVLRTTQRPGFIFSEGLSVSHHNQSFRDWLKGEIGIQDLDNLAKLRISFRASMRVLATRIQENGGIIRSEPAAVLLPGYAITVKLEVVSINNYEGLPAYFCKIIELFEDN